MSDIELENGATLPTYKSATGPRLIRYAWPGGYPVFYINGENCVLCPDCAQESVDEYEPGMWVKNLPKVYGVNWEDPDLFCECGERIESAYAEESVE